MSGLQSRQIAPSKGRAECLDGETLQYRAQHGIDEGEGSARIGAEEGTLDALVGGSTER